MAMMLQAATIAAVVAIVAVPGITVIVGGGGPAVKRFRRRGRTAALRGSPDGGAERREIG
jgi:hypothetical protein